MLAVGGKAADVADADAARIVASTMRPYLGKGTAQFYTSVEQHHVVVADGIEALRAVPTVDVGGGEGFALASGGAMDYDFINLAHNRMLNVEC